MIRGNMSHEAGGNKRTERFTYGRRIGVVAFAALASAGAVTLSGCSQGNGANTTPALYAADANHVLKVNCSSHRPADRVASYALSPHEVTSQVPAGHGMLVFLIRDLGSQGLKNASVAYNYVAPTSTGPARLPAHPGDDAIFMYRATFDGPMYNKDPNAVWHNNLAMNVYRTNDAYFTATGSPTGSPAQWTWISEGQAIPIDGDNGNLFSVTDAVSVQRGGKEVEVPGVKVTCNTFEP